MVENGRATDETINLEDVYEEIDQLMTKQKVDMHKIKPCKRKYCFELHQIPREAEYMKLLYSYDSEFVRVGIDRANNAQNQLYQWTCKARPSLTSSERIQLYSSSSSYGRTSWVLVGFKSMQMNSRPCRTHHGASWNYK